MFNKRNFKEFEYGVLSRNELEAKSIAIFADTKLNIDFLYCSMNYKSEGSLSKKCLLTNRKQVLVKEFSITKSVLRKTLSSNWACGLKRAI
jgi:hypothetical protein